MHRYRGWFAFLFLIRLYLFHTPPWIISVQFVYRCEVSTWFSCSFFSSPFSRIRTFYDVWSVPVESSNSIIIYHVKWAFPPPTHTRTQTNSPSDNPSNSMPLSVCLTAAVHWSNCSPCVLDCLIDRRTNASQRAVGRVTEQWSVQIALVLPIVISIWRSFFSYFFDCCSIDRPLSLAAHHVRNISKYKTRTRFEKKHGVTPFRHRPSAPCNHSLLFVLHFLFSSRLNSFSLSLSHWSRSYYFNVSVKRFVVSGLVILYACTNEYMHTPEETQSIFWLTDPSGCLVVVRIGHKLAFEPTGWLVPTVHFSFVNQP